MLITTGLEPRVSKRAYMRAHQITYVPEGTELFPSQNLHGECWEVEFYDSQRQSPVVTLVSYLEPVVNKRGITEGYWVDDPKGFRQNVINDMFGRPGVPKDARVTMETRPHPHTMQEEVIIQLGWYEVEVYHG